MQFAAIIIAVVADLLVSISGSLVTMPCPTASDITQAVQSHSTYTVIGCVAPDTLRIVFTPAGAATDRISNVSIQVLNTRIGGLSFENFAGGLHRSSITVANLTFARLGVGFLRSIVNQTSIDISGAVGGDGASVALRSTSILGESAVVMHDLNFTSFTALSQVELSNCTLAGNSSLVIGNSSLKITATFELSSTHRYVANVDISNTSVESGSSLGMSRTTLAIRMRNLGAQAGETIASNVAISGTSSFTDPGAFTVANSSRLDVSSDSMSTVNIFVRQSVGNSGAFLGQDFFVSLLILSSTVGTRSDSATAAAVVVESHNAANTPRCSVNVDNSSISVHGGGGDAAAVILSSSSVANRTVAFTFSSWTSIYSLTSGTPFGSTLRAVSVVQLAGRTIVPSSSEGTLADPWPAWSLRESAITFVGDRIVVGADSDTVAVSAVLFLRSHVRVRDLGLNASGVAIKMEMTNPPKMPQMSTTIAACDGVVLAHSRVVVDRVQQLGDAALGVFSLCGSSIVGSTAVVAPSNVSNVSLSVLRTNITSAAAASSTSVEWFKSAIFPLDRLPGVDAQFVGALDVTLADSIFSGFRTVFPPRSISALWYAPASQVSLYCSAFANGLYISENNLGESQRSQNLTSVNYAHSLFNRSLGCPEVLPCRSAVVRVAGASKVLRDCYDPAVFVSFLIDRDVPGGAILLERISIEQVNFTFAVSISSGINITILDAVFVAGVAIGDDQYEQKGQEQHRLSSVTGLTLTARNVSANDQYINWNLFWLNLIDSSIRLDGLRHRPESDGVAGIVMTLLRILRIAATRTNFTTTNIVHHSRQNRFGEVLVVNFYPITTWNVNFTDCDFVVENATVSHLAPGNQTMLMSLHGAAVRSKFVFDRVELRARGSASRFLFVLPSTELLNSSVAVRNCTSLLQSANAALLELPGEAVGTEVRMSLVNVTLADTQLFGAVVSGTNLINSSVTARDVTFTVTSCKSAVIKGCSLRNLHAIRFESVNNSVISAERAQFTAVLDDDTSSSTMFLLRPATTGASASRNALIRFSSVSWNITNFGLTTGIMSLIRIEAPSFTDVTVTMNASNVTIYGTTLSAFIFTQAVRRLSNVTLGISSSTFKLTSYESIDHSEVTITFFTHVGRGPGYGTDRNSSLTLSDSTVNIDSMMPPARFAELPTTPLRASSLDVPPFSIRVERSAVTVINAQNFVVAFLLVGTQGNVFSGTLTVQDSSFELASNTRQAARSGPALFLYIPWPARVEHHSFLMSNCTLRISDTDWAANSDDMASGGSFGLRLEGIIRSTTLVIDAVNMTIGSYYMAHVVWVLSPYLFANSSVVVSNSTIAMNSLSARVLRTFSFFRSSDPSSFFPVDAAGKEYTYRNATFVVSGITIRRGPRMESDLYVASFENRMANATHSDVTFEVRNVTVTQARGSTMQYFAAFYSRSFDESVRLSDLVRFCIIVDGFSADFDFVPTTDNGAVVSANLVHPLVGLMHNRFHNLTLTLRRAGFRTVARQALMLQTRERITFFGINSIAIIDSQYEAETSTFDPLIPAAVYLHETIIDGNSSVALNVENSQFVVSTNASTFGTILLGLDVATPARATLNVSLRHSHATLLNPHANGATSAVVRARRYSGRTPDDAKGRHFINVDNLTATLGVQHPGRLSTESGEANNAELTILWCESDATLTVPSVVSAVVTQRPSLAVDITSSNITLGHNTSRAFLTSIAFRLDGVVNFIATSLNLRNTVVAFAPPWNVSRSSSALFFAMSFSAAFKVLMSSSIPEYRGLGVNISLVGSELAVTTLPKASATGFFASVAAQNQSPPTVHLSSACSFFIVDAPALQRRVPLTRALLTALDAMVVIERRALLAGNALCSTASPTITRSASSTPTQRATNSASPTPSADLDATLTTTATYSAQPAATLTTSCPPSSIITGSTTRNMMPPTLTTTLRRTRSVTSSAATNSRSLSLSGSGTASRTASASFSIPLPTNTSIITQSASVGTGSATATVSRLCWTRLSVRPTAISVLHLRDTFGRFVVNVTHTADSQNAFRTISELGFIHSALSTSWGYIERIVYGSEMSISIVVAAAIDPSKLELFDTTDVTIKIGSKAFECPSSPNPTVLSLTIQRVERAISRETANAVQQVAFTTSMVSGLLTNPSTGMLQARASSLLTQSVCSYSHYDQLDFSESPLGWSVGIERGGYYRGALVGNAVITLGLVVLAAGLVLIYYDPRKPHRTVWGAMGILHLPAVLIVPLGELMQPTTTVATALIIHGEGRIDVGLGLGAYIAMGVIFATVMYKTTCGLRCRVVPRREAFDPTMQPLTRLMYNMFLSQQKWIDITRSDPGFSEKQHWAHFFYDYRASRAAYLTVELFVSFCIGVLAGVKKEEWCDEIALAFLITIGTQTALAFTMRPHLSTFESLFHMTISGATCASAFLLTIGEYKNNTTVVYYSGIFAAVALSTSSAKIFIDIAYAFRWFLSRWQTLRKKRQRQRLLALERAMDDVVSPAPPKRKMPASIKEEDAIDDDSDSSSGADSDEVDETNVIDESKHVGRDFEAFVDTLEAIRDRMRAFLKKCSCCWWCRRNEAEPHSQPVSEDAPQVVVEGSALTTDQRHASPTLATVLSPAFIASVTRALHGAGVWSASGDGMDVPLLSKREELTHRVLLRSLMRHPSLIRRLQAVGGTPTAAEEQELIELICRRLDLAAALAAEATHVVGGGGGGGGSQTPPLRLSSDVEEAPTTQRQVSPNELVTVSPRTATRPPPPPPSSRGPPRAGRHQLLAALSVEIGHLADRNRRIRAEVDAADASCGRAASEQLGLSPQLCERAVATRTSLEHLELLIGQICARQKKQRTKHTPL